MNSLEIDRSIKMLSVAADEKIKLPPTGSWPETVHVFEEESIWAVNAAITSGRPLLIRGEPGVGKSQLARAAAKALNRVFISEVLNARSECQELQWKFDAVARLGEAQALVACKTGKDLRDILNPLKFINPGPLWWAFNWDSALKQAEKFCSSRCEISSEGQKKSTIEVQTPEKPKDWAPEMGSVLLIDEIDKTDADLPNGLLETLGNGAFPVSYMKESVKLKEGIPSPLVVITTNEERELPAAFLRRCMVLQMKLPTGKESLKEWLMERGDIHFGEKCSLKVREEAANQLWKDRNTALEQNTPAPGQAEYIDILRALSKMGEDEETQLTVLKQISKFALKKYPEESL